MIVVGTGYNLAGHVTPETRAAIEQADRVFYLLTDPATPTWLKGVNPAAESLHDCYREGQAGAAASAEMVERILTPVREGLRVCAAFYGHPAILVRPAHDSMRRARAEGYRARMLPAVSFLDCLFADLGIDPGVRGCQLFDATDFLVRRRRFDPETPLVLLQPGAIGVTAYREGGAARPEALPILVEVLRRSYPADHEVVLYEMPQLPILDPDIRSVPLAALADAGMAVNATLFVPPRSDRSLRTT